MSPHRRLLAEVLDFPATADARPEVELDADLARRIAPDLLLPDEESAAVRERTEQLISSLTPWDTFEMWLTGRVALCELRLVRCRAQELLLRDRLARRALLCWDEDRRAAVAALGVTLGRRPDAVAPELGRSRHGCEWLIARWEPLIDAPDAAGTWDDDRRARALDLLGVPRDARTDRSPLDPPPGVDVAAHLRAVAAGELARLRSLKASALDDLDARDRAAAALGVGLDADPELARLRRAERSHELSLQGYLSRFRKARPGSSHPPVPIRRPEPAWTPSPRVEEAAAASSPLDPTPAPQASPDGGVNIPPGPIRVPPAACPPVLAEQAESTGGQAAGGTRRLDPPRPGSFADPAASPNPPARREVAHADPAPGTHPGESPGNRRRRRAVAARAGRGP